jgi:DNA-binding transcriptional regulator YdaS (Cro superfamily)
MNAIQKAAEVCGGQRALAEHLGVTQSAVNQWINGVRPVPPTRCRAIENATGSKVTCEDLRPDVFGPQAAA